MKKTGRKIKRKITAVITSFLLLTGIVDVDVEINLDKFFVQVDAFFGE